jgi:hypothetical protein
MDDVGDRFRIVLKPSRKLLAALGLAYSGAAACLLSLDLEFGAKALMFAFLVLSGVCDSCIHAGGPTRRRVTGLVLHREGDWRVVNGAGEVLRGRPVPGGLVHPLAVCFSIRLADARRLPVLVLADMCGADEFRRLRVWLRLNAEAGAEKFSRTGHVSGSAHRDGGT